MMWRPNHELVGGELDNRTPGTITGWLEFARPGQLNRRITLSLSGNFLADAAGQRIRIKDCDTQMARSGYLDRAPNHIDGTAGDISVGARDRFTHRPILRTNTAISFFDASGDQWRLQVPRRNIRVVGNRRWSVLTGDDSVDRVLVDLSRCYTHSVITIDTRRALQLLHRNGIRETKVLPDNIIDQATRIADEWGIGHPRMSRYANAA